MYDDDFEIDEDPIVQDAPQSDLPGSSSAMSSSAMEVHTPIRPGNPRADGGGLSSPFSRTVPWEVSIPDDDDTACAPMNLCTGNRTSSNTVQRCSKTSEKDKSSAEEKAKPIENHVQNASNDGKPGNGKTKSVAKEKGKKKSSAKDRKQSSATEKTQTDDKQDDKQDDHPHAKKANKDTKAKDAKAKGVKAKDAKASTDKKVNTYNIFVKEQMKLQCIQSLPHEKRLPEISKLWKEQKGLENEASI